MKFEPIAYASHYGGRCRGCADENGVCPTSGLPCDPNLRLKAATHCLKAWQYGIEHGFIDNPFPNSSTPATAEHDAIDAIQRLMDERGLRRKDIFSSKGRASDFMRRKRPLTLPLIQRLHFEFGVPAEVLIAPYRDTPTIKSNGCGDE